MIIELYNEDIFREVDILNYYKGEALKRKDADAVSIETAKEQQDAFIYHLRAAVNDVLLLANPRITTFTAENTEDKLIFSLSPVRENTEHLQPIIKESIRQYLVYEVRRLWMRNVRPDFADDSMRAILLSNIATPLRSTVKAAKVRRRSTNLAGI